MGAWHRRGQMSPEAWRGLGTGRAHMCWVGFTKWVPVEIGRTPTAVCQMLMPERHSQDHRMQAPTICKGGVKWGQVETSPGSMEKTAELGMT